MLQRQIRCLTQTLNEHSLLLRCAKLDRDVEETLWRLLILHACISASDGGSNRFSNSSRGHVAVRQKWISAMNPAVQTWFHHSPNRRKKIKTPKTCKTSKNREPAKIKNLMNRLVADPVSLLVLLMTSGQVDEAAQVADRYRLWETDEGRQFRYRLAQECSINHLREIISRRRDAAAGSSLATDDMGSVIMQGLNQLAVPSGIESELSKLVQICPCEDSEHTARLLADMALSLCSVLHVRDCVEVLDFSLQRINISEDRQPWTCLRRYSRFVEDYCQAVKDCDRLESPLRTCLPFDQLRKHFDCKRQLRRQLIDIEEALAPNPGQDLQQSLQFLDDHLRQMRPDGKYSYLASFGHYLNVMKNLIPVGMSNESVHQLLRHDFHVLVMQRLEENGSLHMDSVQSQLKLINIQLPCLIARFLCTHGPHTKLDHAFLSEAVTFLRNKCPVLADMVDSYLKVQDAPSSTSSLPTLNRLLLIDQETLVDYRTSPGGCVSRRKSTGLLNSARISVDSLDSTATTTTDSHSSSRRSTSCLGRSVLDTVPKSLVCQLEHLVTKPVYMVEQMLMNSQITPACDVMRLFRTEMDSKTIESLLFRYASKALTLILPESTCKKDSSTAKKKKRKLPFCMPATAPSKDLWVANDEVTQCPCCEIVQFSMFNRRHHCRRCGRVVCSCCSAHRLIVDGYGDVAVRTCNDCFAVLSLADSPVAMIPALDGLWMLSADDEQHNDIVRREFSYEHAPNLALALAVVRQCSDSEHVAHFLLNQSSSMLAALHHYLLNRVQLEVDPVMILQLIKSLVVTAKMRYTEIVSTDTQKPSRGLVRCDALLGQIDLLALLASANCLHLLPAQPLAQQDTWRKLRDRLIDNELWTLALDVSTKAGLDAGSVWAAWGLVCLKVGHFQGARQRFQRCLKPAAKMSPLLNEIVSALEHLNPPSYRPDDGGGDVFHAKTAPVTGDQALIVSSLARLNDICSGRFYSKDDGDGSTNEILFYLRKYTSAESCYIYLVERLGRIGQAVGEFFHQINQLAPDVFVRGLLLPCLRSGRLEQLIADMRRHDDSLHAWRSCLLAGSQFLESKSLYNSVYQFYCLAGDHIRACLTAIRKIFFDDLFTVQTYLARCELLEEMLAHLDQVHEQLEQQQPQEKMQQWPLCWPAHEVDSLRRTIQLQMLLTKTLDQCYRKGKVSDDVLVLLKKCTQVGGGSASAADADVSDYIPSLFGSRNDRCAAAALVTVVSATNDTFEIAWTICQELRLRVDRYFRMSSYVLIKLFQVNSLVALIDFIALKMSSVACNDFDLDMLLVECAVLVHERDENSKRSDVELIVQQIKKVDAKIQAYIQLGWLKAAYLLAVKNALSGDVLRVQHEAARLQQTAVLTLCNKWLSARNTHK